MVLDVATIISNSPTVAAGGPHAAGTVIAEEIERQVQHAAFPPVLDSAVRAQFAPGARTRQGPWTLFGLLALHAFESAGGVALEAAAPAAAAVEFVAAAGSVLDDLQDLDAMAGIDDSQPGAGAEVVALLMVLSQRAMASLDFERVVPERALTAYGILSRCELDGLVGQHRSIGQSDRTDVTLGEAADAACAKSGSFGRLAAEVGASLATDDHDCIERHGRFGWHAAVIDQMQNDIAGVWPGGEPSTDISLGRMTPPVVFALELPQGVSEAADEVRSALRDRGKTLVDESRVREALFRSGGIHYAWIAAAVHKARAMRIADGEALRSPGSRLADLLRL